MAESRYEDEPDVTRVTAGQSAVDKPNVTHSLYRNPDPNSPLKFLVAFTIKKGDAFFKVR